MGRIDGNITGCGRKNETERSAIIDEGFEKKRERLSEQEKTARQKLAELEQKELELIEIEKDIERNLESIHQKHRFIEKYPPDVQKFLLKHSNPEVFCGRLFR